MAVKLVALDLDGTLLNSKKQVSEYTKNVIKRLSNEGIIFTFCTGRIYNELVDLINELPFIQYAIACNGAFIHDLHKNEVIFENLLDMQDVRKIYHTFKDFRMMFEIFADGKVIVDERSLEHLLTTDLGVYRDFIIKTRKGIPDLYQYINERNQPVGKVNIFFDSKETRSKAMGACKDIHLDITMQEYKNLEFNRLGANKGSALQHLAEIMGFTSDEVMAIGDNHNDIAMLKYANYSVAMDNADEQIKTIARFTTKSNDENGVAFALETFI
jgi:Cof subfamily protein (haloacid dehalogenase superfamily)